MILLPAAEPGVAPWSTDAGVELPVRFRGLTIGRYVLTPATRTVGVALPPGARAAALAMVAEAGAAIANANVGG